MSVPFYIPVTYQGGIGNTLKGFISALTVSNDVKIVCNYNTLLGNYDTVLDKEFVGDSNNRESFSSCRFLILKSEEEDQVDLRNEYSSTDIDLNNRKFWHFFSQKTIDWYFDKKLICDKVLYRILGAFQKIQWLPIITSEVDTFVKKMKFPSMGVSIRSWKAHHPGDIGCKRPYNSQVYIDAMNSVLIKKKDINQIYMSYDNLNNAENYKEFLKDYDVISYSKPDYINDLQFAIIDMLILSKCNYYVCNRQSTYAEMVFWLSKCEQIVTTVY
jgi:hypothetical protein